MSEVRLATLIPSPKAASPKPAQAGDKVSLAVLLLAIVVLGMAGVMQGPDGNYDLRNYHYYNGFALLHKRVGYDLAPAQIQSYLHPLLDSALYLVSRALNSYPRVFTFLWGIPQAVAVWLAFLAARICFQANGRSRDWLALIAAAIGAGGATSVGVVGTSMSEGVPNAFMVGSLLALLAADRRDRQSQGGVLACYALGGAAAGAAAALKLTEACYLIAFWATMLLVPLLQRRLPRPRHVATAGIGTILGLATIGLPWWLAVYREFGNPLFPFFNTIFKSPYYVSPVNFFDARFFPKTVFEWIFLPLEWSLRKSTRVSETPVRDLRIGLALLAALFLVVRGVWQEWHQDRAAVRASAAPLSCGVFFLSGYAIWLRTFSILRYASALETISGLLLMMMIAALLAGPRLALPRVAVGMALLVLLVSTTVYPTWERRQRDPGTSFVTVTMETLPKDSTVILIVPTPASYVAAFQDPAIRFIGVNNSLIALDTKSAWQNRIEHAIDDAPGPIWGIDKTDAFFGMEEPALERYGLRRTSECSPILSTVDYNLRLCRLERVK